MNLKHILPLEINFKLKNSFKKRRINLDAWNEKSKNKYIYFLDTPEYGNIGDQAIAYAMQKFMNDYFPKYVQREIQENKTYSCLNQLKKIVKFNDIICLTGGGNMGVRYQKYEAIRRIIIKSFPNNLIVIFPSTIDYDNTRYGLKELKNAQKIYNAHKKLVCLARENKSFNIMKEKFYNAKVIRCPDIVLYLDYRDIVKNRKKSIGICLRNDKEKIVSNLDVAKINMNDYEIKNISTIENNNNNITEVNRKIIVEDKLKEIATNKYFITDRLHGMIFAFITNTSCIALPNSNGKVEGVYDWIDGRGKVTFERKFNGKFITRNKKNETLKKEFESLANKIGEVI